MKQKQVDDSAAQNLFQMLMFQHQRARALKSNKMRSTGSVMVIDSPEAFFCAVACQSCQTLTTCQHNLCAAHSKN